MLLRPLGRVDLIDADLQGGQADVLESSAASLDSKVRRVFVGTHNPGVEVRLRGLFQELGWISVYDFPGGSASDTRWDWIMFEDGAQTWLNRKLKPDARLKRAHPQVVSRARSQWE